MDVIGITRAITAMLQKIATAKRGDPDGRPAVRRCHRRGAVFVCDRHRRPFGDRSAGDVLAGRRSGAGLPDPRPGFLLSHGAWRSNLVERTPGYVIPILKYHGSEQETCSSCATPTGSTRPPSMRRRREALGRDGDRGDLDGICRADTRGSSLPPSQPAELCTRSWTSS